MLWATRQSALRLHRSYGWHAFSSTSILRAQQRAPEVRTSRPTRAISTSRLAEEVEGLEKIVEAMNTATNSRGGKESISYEAENLSIYKEGRDPVITVRLPRRINSLLEVYAIVRAVEDKYGRVKDFKVSRVCPQISYNITCAVSSIFCRTENSYRNICLSLTLS